MPFCSPPAPSSGTPAAEITTWEYVAQADLDSYVAPGLARRLRAAQPGELRYLNHGTPPRSTETHP